MHGEDGRSRGTGSVQVTAHDAEPLWPLPEPALNPQQHRVHRPTRRGRRFPLSPEAEQHFFMLLRMGQSRRAAAVASGISPETVSALVRRGQGRDPRRRPRPEDVAFANAVELAEAEAEVMITANLVRLSRTSVRAALEWLRARHPERWSPSRETTREDDQGDEPTVPSASVAQPARIIRPGSRELQEFTSSYLAERRVRLAADAVPDHE